LQRLSCICHASVGRGRGAESVSRGGYSEHDAAVSELARFFEQRSDAVLSVAAGIS
jgi:hypothetical protein